MSLRNTRWDTEAMDKNEPINLTPKEAAKRLRLGRTKTYELIASGKLDHFRVGRKILVPTAAIQTLEDAR